MQVLNDVVEAVVKAMAERVVTKALADETDALAEAARPLLRTAVETHIAALDNWQTKDAIKEVAERVVAATVVTVLSERADVIGTMVRDAVDRLLTQPRVDEGVRAELQRRIDAAVANASSKGLR